MELVASAFVCVDILVKIRVSWETCVQRYMRAVLFQCYFTLQIAVRLTQIFDFVYFLDFLSLDSGKGKSPSYRITIWRAL